MTELHETGYLTLSENLSNVFLVVKDGFDGAGGQTKIITREMSKLVSSGELEVTKMELFGFVPLELYDVGHVSYHSSKKRNYYPYIKSFQKFIFIFYYLHCILN